MEAKHDHNGIYPHKDVCNEIQKGLEVKLINKQYQINTNREDIKSIKLKINATLIGVIGILISIVFLFLK